MSATSKWQHSPKWNGKFSWTNAGFLIVTPLLAAILVPMQIWQTGLAWSDFGIFLFMVLATGFSITAGYHRLFAHQTYESSALVRFFYLVFGAAALQNSAFKWSSDHRYHHRFVDKEGDPYSIQKGFFHAHMGWVFQQDPNDRSFENASDLAADKLVDWQHRYYLPIAITAGLGLPTLLGWFFGRPYEGLLMGGLVRIVFVHHGTFLINSASHTFGTRPYSTKNSARDCWWLSLLTNGEGYHNFHHAFANDYRNGVRWYQWDPSKWFIWSLSKVGLSYDLRRTPDSHILKARLESAYEDFRRNWNKEVPSQLEHMRASIEEKLQEFQQKVREFHAWKESRALENARIRRVRARYWQRRLRHERKHLENSLHEYRALLQLTRRYGHSLA